MKKGFLLILFTLLLSKAFAGINSDSLKVSNAQSCPEKSSNHGFVFDIGFNQLLDVPDLLELNNWRSKGLNIYYLYSIPLIGNAVSFNPGLGVSFENYSFRNNIRYNVQEDSLTFYIEDEAETTFRKSKMGMTYLDIPMELRFSTSSNMRRAFKVAIGGKFGFLINSTSKVKYDVGRATVKVKESHFFYLNPIRYGLTGRIGYGCFNLFGYYSLSELFELGKGPEVTPVMFGVSLTTF